MKHFAPILLLGALACASAPVAADPEPKSEDEKTLYALGLGFSKQIAVFKLTPAELAILQSGISDGAQGKTPKVNLEEYGPKIQALAMQRMSAGAAAEKQKGKDYLAKIAEKPGIKKTGTGLLMETVTEGTGASPGPEDNVKVLYKGTLMDGTVFDESAKYGGPSTMKLGGNLIKCWNEAITLMKVGGKAKLYCPADLAYGDRPNGMIPAGGTLIFELELLEVVK